MQNNTLWKSKLGFVLAASGSAIGLGNIWKFPYMISQYGGGAFLLIYIACIIIIGYPLVVSEALIGRKFRASAYNAYQHKSKFWKLPGTFAFVATSILCSFYIVVAGWALNYLFNTITGKISFNVSTNTINYSSYFNNMLSSNLTLIIYAFAIFGLVALFSLRGVNKGVEKLNYYAMPLLLIVLIILAFKSLSLPESSKAISYLFSPNFYKINSAVVIAALGQAFFSLSLASGSIIVFASYVNQKENILKSSAYTVGLDTLVGVLAAIIVVPIVFSFGQDLNAGPSLTFITLPYMFASMKGGIFFALLFFILLVIASITSIVAMIEVIAISLIDIFKNKITRSQAVIIMFTVIFIASIFQAGSFNFLSHIQVLGLSIFDSSNYLASNILFPLGGLLTAIYVGYILPKKELIKELQGNGTIKISTWFLVFFITLIRYIIPILIILIMLDVTGFYQLIF